MLHCSVVVKWREACDAKQATACSLCFELKDQGAAGCSLPQSARPSKAGHISTFHPLYRIGPRLSGTAHQTTLTTPRSTSRDFRRRLSGQPRRTPLSKLLINLLEMIQEPLEQLHAQPGIHGAGRGRADSMGPTVPPLRESLRIWKACSALPVRSATRCSTAVEAASARFGTCG